MDDISHIEALFEKYEDEYLKFNRIETERRLSKRPDLHAFLLLDGLFQGIHDIVGGAGHDQIWLEIETDDIAKLTEEQVIELCRCGVFIDEESLSMFV